MTDLAPSPQPPAVTLVSPFIWLARGWRDLLRSPVASLAHGLGVGVFGLALLWWARDQFWWLVGAFSGFLIVAPVLATGLYAISRAAEEGKPLGLAQVWALWHGRDPRLVTFGLLLGLAGTGWVLTSAGLITLWSDAPVAKPIDFIQHVVLAEHSMLFEVWILLGAVLAAPMFASSVVTLPMLVDTDYPVWRAVSESWRAVANHPLPMALWALLIAVLVGLGLSLASLGLVVVVPVLGHASWHAYRDVTGAATPPSGAGAAG